MSFVLLENIKNGKRFFTTYTEGEDPTKSVHGEVWYRIIGYAKTVQEAQENLW